MGGSAELHSESSAMLGILAVQLGFASESQVLRAAADRSGPLGEQLVAKGVLTAERKRLLESMVEQAIRDHGGDLQKAFETLTGQNPALASLVTVVPEHSRETPPLDESGDPRVPLEHPGHYTVRGEYGRGGQSRVLLASDEFIGREVALKELLPLEERKVGDLESTPRPHSIAASARFLREARITGQLEHPNIVPVYELGRHSDGRYFYAQKLVRGSTLRRRLSDCKSITDRLKLLPHFAGVCNAVAYAHSRGVIHRDLKPENVMVGEFGETVLLDWGLAKAKGTADPRSEEIARKSLALREGPRPVAVSDVHQTLQGAAMGTPHYMAPEQAMGKVDQIDERSDAWGLGAILYEILSGRPPFDGATPFEVIGKVLREEVPKLAEVAPEALSAAPELAAVVERALQRDPAKRYQAVSELAQEIEAFQVGGRVRAYSYSSWELARGFVERNRALSAMSALALLLVALAAGSIWRERDRVETAQGQAQSAQQRAREMRAEALLSQARQSANELDWPRAAALYAAARAETESREARLGLLAARDRSATLLFRRSGPPGFARRAAFLADGRAAALGAAGWFDIETGAALPSAEATSPAAGKPLPFVAAGDVSALSGDGALAASGGRDHAVLLWDARAGELCGRLPLPAPPEGLAISADGARLAVAFGGGVQVWQLPPRLRSVRLASDRLVEHAASAAGKLLVAGPQGLAVFDAAGNQLARRDGLAAGGVALSPDGQIAAVATGGAVAILEAASLRELRRLNPAGDALAFSDDGAKLLTGGTSIALWEAGAERWRVASKAAAVALSGTVAAAAIPGAVVVLDAKNGHELWRAAWDAQALAIAGDSLAAAGAAGIAVWDLPAHRLRWRVGSEARELAAADDSTLVAAGRDGVVRVFSAGSGREWLELPRHLSAARAVVGNRALIASAGETGRGLRIFALADAASLGAPEAELAASLGRLRLRLAGLDLLDEEEAPSAPAPAAAPEQAQNAVQKWLQGTDRASDLVKEE